MQFNIYLTVTSCKAVSKQLHLMPCQNDLSIYLSIYLFSGNFFLNPDDFVRLPTDKDKWSVYNFNYGFILTVKDRITTTKSRKTHFKNIINWLAF